MLPRPAPIRPRLLLPALLLLAGGLSCGQPDDAPRAWEGSPPAAEEPAEDSTAGEAETGDAAGSTVHDGTGTDPGIPIDSRLDGRIVIDGSSTVFPITEAMADRFRDDAPEVEILLGVSGTGGGFRKFCRGETDLSDASRPIEADERAACRRRGIRFVELPVAFDGISVVVHRSNRFVRCLEVEELRRLWSRPTDGGEHDGDAVERWNDLRPNWPAEEIHLFGAGHDSGTFDYFTRAVVGRQGACREDYVASEDDYLIAQDVASDPAALGFFGLAYLRAYRDRLRPVAIDAGAGCVEPTPATIADGTYQPLSRPLFVYAALDALGRPEVRAFLRLYLHLAGDVVPEVGYVVLPDRAYELARQRLEARRTGSVFDGAEVGVSIESLLEREEGDS